MCASGKVGYATAQAAASVLQHMGRTSTHSQAARKAWNGGRLKHYRCPMCSEWHIGHTTKPQGKRA